MTEPIDLWRRIAADYGTPAYVYQLDELRRAAADLRASLPDAVPAYYSVKANPHPRLIDALVADGFDLEISSTGELDAAQQAGGDPGRFLYTGPGKTLAEMATALRAGVRLFSVESEADHTRLADAAGRVGGAQARYLIRLNPGVGTGPAGLRMTGGPSQFGVPVDQLRPDSALFRPSGGIRPAGFHLFSASNIADGGALLAELAANAATAATLAKRAGFDPEMVDIGGGFAAPFTVPGARPSYPDLRGGLTAALGGHLPGWGHARPVVTVESGRYLVASAGVLLTSVMDVKTSGDRRYVVCDAGVNALGGMSGLGRLLPPGAQPCGYPGDAGEHVLAGPLCTPLDVLSRRGKIADPRVDDVLAIPNVGAYGLTASLVAFLGRPMPVEVVLDGTRVVDVRRLAVHSLPVHSGKLPLVL